MKELIAQTLADLGVEFSITSKYSAQGKEDSYFIEVSAENNLSTKDRNKMPSSDFVDSKKRAFPINSPEAVRSAVSSWGRYKGTMTFDQFKTRLKLICKRKGPAYEAALPQSWKNESK